MNEVNSHHSLEMVGNAPDRIRLVLARGKAAVQFELLEGGRVDAGVRTVVVGVGGVQSVFVSRHNSS